MIVLQAAGLDKSLGGKKILDSVDFTLMRGEKVGLVGVNGSGKSTLLACLCQLTSVDMGRVHQANLASLGYLEQMNIENQDLGLWEYVMGAFRPVLEMRREMASLEIMMKSSPASGLLNRYAALQEEYELAGGYACETDARRILSGLGFKNNQFGQRISQFSGGQKTRIKLARLLAAKPDCLLLDEPTNHLDTGSVEWLEEFLSKYPGTLLIVTHDRMLLEKVPTRIIELRRGRLYSFKGNYTRYLQQKAAQDAAWEKAYSRQQEYIKKTEEFINRYRAGVKARQARGREAQLKKVSLVEQPAESKGISTWPLPEVLPSGSEIVEAEGLAKGFSGGPLFSGISLKIRKGDKIALIGANGSGKTTLLRSLLGLETLDQGEVRWGARVRPGYFNQESENLKAENTLLEEILDGLPFTLEQARTYLGSIRFSGDAVFKRVGQLSGGERGRLALLKLLLHRPNILILDEPTNHLDLNSFQVVEDLLQAYPGTILMVSHDRHFIDRVCHSLAVLENQTLTLYPGNYTYYREKQALVERDSPPATSVGNNSLKPNSGGTLAPRPMSPYQLNKRLNNIETQIAQWEKEKKIWEEKLSSPGCLATASDISQWWVQLKELEEKLDEAYSEWENLSLMLES